MITVRQLVETELEASPELTYLLAENLLNINGLARRFRPAIQKQLGEAIGVETISMAIRRFQQKQTIAPSRSLHLPTAKNLQVQLDVAVLTYTKKLPLDALSNGKDYRFFSLAKGRDATMLAISQEDTAPFKDAVSKYQQGMAAITITLEHETLDSVGAYAYIQTTLAIAGVPVAEVLSVHDDLTLIIKDEHVDRAFQTLRNTLKTQ